MTAEDLHEMLEVLDPEDYDEAVQEFLKELEQGGDPDELRRAATLVKKGSRKGIWIAGPGTVLTVLALLLTAGWSDTYYPSLAAPQSSLTLANSCSSFFTLKVMAVVSLLIPFVLAYIAWAWRTLERTPIEPSDTAQTH